FGVLGLIITFSLTTPASALIINGIPYGDEQTNPNQYYTTTYDSNGNTVYNVTGGQNTTGTNGTVQAGSLTPQYVNGRWSEGTLRSFFGYYNIDTGSGATLYGLGNFGITGLVSLKRTIDYYTLAMRGTDRPLFNLHITHGAETYGTDAPELSVASDNN